MRLQSDLTYKLFGVCCHAWLKRPLWFESSIEQLTFNYSRPQPTATGLLVTDGYWGEQTPDLHVIICHRSKSTNIDETVL